MSTHVRSSILLQEENDFWDGHIAVVDPEGVQGVRLNPPFFFLKSPMKKQ